jgi:hypothetical protein
VPQPTAPPRTPPYTLLRDIHNSHSIKCSLSFKYRRSWVVGSHRDRESHYYILVFCRKFPDTVTKPSYLEINFTFYSQFILQDSSFSAWNFRCCSPQFPQNSQRQQLHASCWIPFNYYCHTCTWVTPLRSGWSELSGIYWPYDLPPSFQETLLITERSQLSVEGLRILIFENRMKIVFNQFSETNVMHFLFNLLRIRGLYIFRALLAHPQEAFHKRHMVYCMRVMSVGCTRIEEELHYIGFNILIQRMRINYRRISLRHNLSKKCYKIVKFMSITHSERNIWNGSLVATAIPREKRKLVLEGNGCCTDRA